MSILLEDLNTTQQQAVTHEGTPLLILAGAGSGKTRALTYRAAYLMQEKNVPAERILLTTFTNKAAQEMQERLFALTHARLPFAGTFHSLSARILRKFGPEIDLDHNFVIYDQDDTLSLLKQSITRLNLNPKEVRPRTVQYMIEGAKQELVDPVQYESYARGPLQQNVAKVYALYQRLLTEANAVDFNDLLFLLVRLMNEKENVREYFQERFLHVLVDEYQDTNKAQYQLTKVFSAKHRNLCVVGDASQAIYSWRGADYRNLQLLHQDFADLTVIKLEQNYRSTQMILDAAYGVIGNNTLHPVLSLWTTQKEGKKLTVYKANDEYDEARYIWETIQDARRSDETLRLKDFVILYRTNAQSRSIEEVFIRQGVPYLLVGGVKFYERAEVKDVLAYLRYSYNRKDLVSLQRAQKNGKRRLQSIELWLQTADLGKAPITLVDEVLEKTQYLDKYDKKVPEDLARIENVLELRSVAGEFETMGEFLENVALVEQDTTSKGWVGQSKALIADESQDAVVLMTLHASKGLEFKTVFMVGMEEGLFPHSRSLLSREELEEERRLCYVGITRARKYVYFTHSRNRTYFGSFSQNQPSRFLTELPIHTLASPLVTETPNVPTKTSAIDDDMLDKLINNEIDIETFLKS